MRQLERASVNKPNCLANYQAGTHSWGDVISEHKEEIREGLEQLQGRRCAYCEGCLDSLGNHIEHFRRKGDSRFQHLTFSWENLYWSCDQNDSCGKYKDQKAGSFDINDIIDPCNEDPERFFRFRSDGTISVRAGLDANCQRRAEETIRVFNLQSEWGRLRNMRKSAVSGYISLVEDCAEFSREDLQHYFTKELSEAANKPFFTAIKHVLTES